MVESFLLFQKRPSSLQIFRILTFSRAFSRSLFRVHLRLSLLLSARSAKKYEIFIFLQSNRREVKANNIALIHFLPSYHNNEGETQNPRETQKNNEKKDIKRTYCYQHLLNAT